MERMKKLLYSHARAISIAEVLFAWLYRVTVQLTAACLRKVSVGRRGRRYLAVGFVVLILVAEFVMLYTLAELVELCIRLMEVWTELAAKHLEITLDRN
jgi:hypothetical protein